MTTTTSTPARPVTSTPPGPAADPTTAAALLATVQPFGPAADGAGLAFDLDPPAELVAALALLHTGVRALLAGRGWFGCGSDRRTAAPRLLNPEAPIPEGVTLLCVEGDQRWDRIDPSARLDLPAMFG